MEKLPNQADEELGEKYDIVFIGGGPATLAFFSFICRNKNFENFFANLSILILEKSETFGSGCLGKYGINSNTSAEGFVRLICFNDDENGKEEKQNLSPNKKKPSGENSKNNFFSMASNNSNNNNNNVNNNNNKSNNDYNNNNNNASTSNFSNSAIFQKFKSKCVPVFEDLLHSNETKNLLNIGSKIAPLSMIGVFLDCVGNSIASYIFSKFHKRIFMNFCEVTKINVDYEKCFESNSLKTSDIKNSSVYPFEICVEKNLSRINNQNKNSHNNNKNNNNKENSDFIKRFTVKSKILIMASGAQQKFDNKQKQEILRLITPSDFFHSDYVLQEAGFNHLINNLKLKEKKRVVILGGSHSGFSCAWMLLNGHIDMHKLKEQNKSIRAQSVLINGNNQNNNSNNNPTNNNSNNPTNNNSTNNNGFFYKCKTNPNCLECKTLNCCCCFGSIIDRTWRKPQSAASPHQSSSANLENQNFEITILFRDHIKVYYHSEREALNDGYNVYDQNKAVNKNGNVYPFIGIRGDAKELYRKIVTGKEKRVKLQKANNFNEQKNFISKASVVIWACGYTTQKMSFFDANSKSKEIEFFSDANNQFDVDKELRLLSGKKKTPFFNLFGIGQGYSTHSIELLGNGKFARADSVNLYNTYISKKLFKALDFIFNFSGESGAENNNNNNNEKEKEKEKEKENMMKTANASKVVNNNNEKSGNKKLAYAENNICSNNNNGNFKQTQNAENAFNNTNKKTKENAAAAAASNKKIIQLIPSDASNLRNSTNNNNNNHHHNSKAKNNSSIINNNNNINNNSSLAANSTLLKKTNSQNLFNSPNIKTVKMISNNPASLTIPSNVNLNNLNNASEAKKISLSKNSVLTNSVFQSNLNSNSNNNGILRASYPRGLDKFGSSSKTNFYKNNNNNNESNLEYNNINNNNNNTNNQSNNKLFNGNNNNEFSPPSRNLKSRSPVNVQVNETAVANRSYPTKRESSRLKALQSIANMNMNFNNANSNNNNNQNSLGNTKTNAVSKNYANLNPANNNNNNLNVNTNFGNTGNNFYFFT